MKMSSVTAWGRLSRTAGLLALLAAMHPAVYAQTQAFSASLSGLVHDSSQAVVAGAKVTRKRSHGGKPVVHDRRRGALFIQPAAAVDVRSYG